jgi:hypothetical protein
MKYERRRRVAIPSLIIHVLDPFLDVHSLAFFHEQLLAKTHVQLLILCEISSDAFEKPGVAKKSIDEHDSQATTKPPSKDSINISLESYMLSHVSLIELDCQEDSENEKKGSCLSSILRIFSCFRGAPSTVQPSQEGQPSEDNKAPLLKE